MHAQALGMPVSDSNEVAKENTTCAINDEKRGKISQLVMKKMN